MLKINFKRTLKFSFLLLLILLVGIAFTACDLGTNDEVGPDGPEESYNISGQVVDFSGDPVDDATIVISEEESISVDDDGNWQASGLTGENKVELAEDGLPESYTVSDGESDLEFLMVNLPDVEADENNIQLKMEELTSDEFEGRLAGLSGAKDAEEFIYNYFDEYNLEKYPEKDSYKQEFNHYVYYPRQGSTSLMQIVNEEDSVIRDFEPLKNFIPRNSFAPASLNKDINSAEIHIYDGDINEKHEDNVLLVPENEAFSTEKIYASDNKTQIEATGVNEDYPIQSILAEASDNGVAGVIIRDYTPENHNYLSRTVSVDDSHDYQSEHPAVFSADSNTYQQLKQDSKDEDFVNIEIDYKFEEVTSNNIVGYIEGESNETLIIGAHFDHAGFGYNEYEEKVIYPGALDNASGTVAMMKLAKYASEFGTPEKNLVFAGFNAEELGLKGSRYFVDELSQMDNIQYINLDMIDDPIGLYNQEDKEVPLVAKLDRIFFEGMDLEGESVEDRINSDNLSFSNHPDVEYKDVMALSKPDIDEVIHTPADDMEAVDVDNISEIVDGLLIYLYNLAY